MHEVRIISCLDIELQLVKLVCFQIWHAALILSKKKKVKQSHLHLLKKFGRDAVLSGKNGFLLQ